jgi:nitric oxide reductase activation protein
MDDKQFDKVIRVLKKQAKTRGGYVLHEEVNELITDEFEITELDRIYDKLGDLKIEFFDDEESARQKMELKEQRRLKKLKTEKKAAKANVKYDDPVRMYLREMGKVPLWPHPQRDAQARGSARAGDDSARRGHQDRSEYLEHKDQFPQGKPAHGPRGRSHRGLAGGDCEGPQGTGG